MVLWFTENTVWRLMIKEVTELQALAQSGLAYCADEFDIKRYQRILEISAVLLALKSEHSYKDIIEWIESDTGYCTPKVDTRGAIFKQEQILLVQEKSNGLWSLPGGWADVNLSPSENIIKEIREETGLHCTVSKLVGVFDKRKNNPEEIKWPHVYKLFFLCEIKSSQKDPFDYNEISDFCFFDLTQIPPLSIGRTNRQQIELCFKHLKNPGLTAEFD
ncbi:MAG: NUDIX hydrolase [Alphaproteobacteria bacterium]|nr:NUDIX hydrolase [Alphaproteobacteria bacterium]